MFFKIKELFLLIFLILLQSCSGGGIGNFLELSFENLENIKRVEDSKNTLENKTTFNLEKNEINKKNIKEINTKENLKNVLNNKKLNNLEKNEINKKKTREIKKK